MGKTEAMSEVFFTSDLHIGHTKIAEIRFPKIKTILEETGWEPKVVAQACTYAHDELLAHHWDAVVGKDDVVWVCGDISSGTKTAQLNALEWIKARPGKKHLIAGNHDSVHPLHRDSYKWLPIYLDSAFATVQMAAKRRIPLPEGHVTALLSHFPYSGDHEAVDRYPEWRLPDTGHYVLHGHVHSEQKVFGHYRQIHVGVDARGFKPVPLQEIVDYINRIEEIPF